MTNQYFQNFDLNGYVNEYITHKLFDVALVGLKNAVKRINKEKNIIQLKRFEQEDCIQFISRHISDNMVWAMNISFRNAVKAKKLTDIFVELDLFISPIKLRYDSKENIPTIPISELFSDTEQNIILLGQPGAGKTTSAKKIFLELLSRDREVYKIFSFPIVIKLKELTYTKEDNGLILFKEILNTLGIFYSFDGNLDEFARKKVLVHIFKDFIERLDVIIILDGYDEISNWELKTEIVRNLNLITNSMMNSKFILTSRSADYDVHIENSSEYEICPLSENQIEDFVFKWINDTDKSKPLLLQLRDSPYWDTTIRPLTLAHLCALYERNLSIPEKPKSVYKKIIELLLEDWSYQNQVSRKSKYSKFETDRKMEFLSRFAYELTVEYGRISFNQSVLKSIYKDICMDFRLPMEESKDVVKEIESHNGLIIQTGSDNYEFAHKSILEYLVADYLVKLPIVIRNSNLYNLLPNELAIMIAISSNTNLTYYQLIQNVFQNSTLTNQFLLPFLQRLIIEKPDFLPNILFSISNIYLINKVSEKLGLIEDKFDQGDFEDDIQDSDIDDDDEIEPSAGISVDQEIDNYFTRVVDEKDFYTSGELNNLKDYYLECLDILMSYLDDPVFQLSLKEITSFYKIGEIKLTFKSPNRYLSTLGKTYHLRRFKSKFTTQSIRVELLDNLIIVQKFKIK